jgi:hypothetical protein
MAGLPVSAASRPVLPDGTRFVMSMESGGMRLGPLAALDHYPLSAEYVASNTQGTWAYTRTGDLFVRHGEQEQRHTLPNGHQAEKPTWSADNKAIAFLGHAARADAGRVTVYWLDLTAPNPTPRALHSAYGILAPPVANPATGHLVIAEWAGGDSTALHMLDPKNPILQKPFAVIPYAVDWLSYHPSATGIAFSDKYSGGLYLLSPATGQVTSVLTGGKARTMPTFSPDGTQLLYLISGQPAIYDLTLKSEQLLPLYSVSSIDWLR